MTEKKEEEKPKSAGATFSLIEKKKDLDDLELLDGSKIFFKSVTDFDDVDFLGLQKKLKASMSLGDKFDKLADDDPDDAEMQKAMKQARLALDGVLKIILIDVTEKQLKSIGGFWIKMDAIRWWSERNIGKKAQGQQV